jgi:hypothetical protein
LIGAVVRCRRIEGDAYPDGYVFFQPGERIFEKEINGPVVYNLIPCPIRKLSK